MMPRPRKKGRGDLPKYLYKNGKSFIYKPPGYDAMGMGTNRAAAIEAAKTLNEELGLNDDVGRLVKKFTGATGAKADLLPDTVLLADALDEWIVFWRQEKRPKASTDNNTRQRVERLKRGPFAELPIAELGTFECAQILDGETRSEYPKVRSILSQACTFAKEKGWLSSSAPNPAKETGTRRKKDKERKRMTLEQFWAIYERSPAFIQIAMDTCMITTLRRGDLCMLRLDDQNPNYFLRDNKLYVIPEKSDSENRSKGPSYLYWDLDKHPRLAATIQRARESSMAVGRCPFVIHVQPKRITQKVRDAKEHHAQVLKGWFSKQFAYYRQKAIDETDLFEDYRAEELPGIHEVRALAAHLLDKQKADKKSVQELLAHTDQAMTEYYQDGHGIEWKEITLNVDY